MNGPQVEIEIQRHERRGVWLHLWRGGRGLDDAREAKLIPHKHFKDEQWNTYRVLAQGARIQVWINGTQISDLTDEEKLKSHPKGFIGLQVHGIGKKSGPFEVRWRNLEIIELK